MSPSRSRTPAASALVSMVSLSMVSLWTLGCGPRDDAVTARPVLAPSVPAARDELRIAGGLERATPAQLCAAGCDRVDRCRDELLPERSDAVARCHRECARLDQGRREGMEQLEACLSVEGCQPFAACLAEPPDDAGAALASLPQGETVTECEAVCGAYADCASRTGRASLDMAAGLEMRCLTRCQQLGEGGEGPGGAAPEVAACGAKARCEPLIACVQQATIAVPSEGQGVEAGEADDGRSVCERVCERAVTCQDWGPGTREQQREAVTQCSEQICQQRRDPALVRRIEACVVEDDCTAFMQCIYQRT